MKKFFLIIAVMLLAIGIVGILFIKLNTTAAAELTDNVLRPMFGSNNIIWLEKVFFNTSDKIQQLTTNKNNITGPQFSDENNVGLIPDGGMNYSNIPIDPSFSPIKGEGEWKEMKLTSFPNKGVMAYTFVRPDKERPYAIVTIAQLDLSYMNLGIVAGIKEPAAKVGNPGPGVVPAEIVNSNKLVAAFDGGFQYRDGAYGMIVGDKTYLPLQKDLGTVVGYKDGTIKIINYQGQDLGKNVAFVRQNCPILVENGQLSASDVKNKKLWGRTMTTNIYTWRTGMGIDKKGNLLFAVGNSLNPETLAKALKMAGAENAIQLDINPNWVRFNIFSPQGDGKYTSKPLTRDLKDGSVSYLTGNGKDFFYVYKK